VAGLDPSALDPAALLGRPELVTDLAAARRALRGRRMLVTGAGGSVGVHLVELLLGLDPERLTLLDHHDHALFTLKGRLDRAAPGGPWRLALADVRDEARLARELDAARPQVVFHLAAYKHVPFGEAFPEETFAVNVLATAGLLRLAGERGVERFVYPSSDKAVNPPSLYGATKRLSEALVQQAARDHGHRYVVARYVNILGTHGSVIETFAEQLASGQPLTVTDARMTRYWISMREATWLLAQAATVGTPGSVLMLDAREEIPVTRIARRVEALLAPDTGERPLRFTGLRPGERLREELLSEHEAFEPGPCAGLLVVRNARREEHLARLPGLLEPLSRLAADADGDRLKAAAMEAARALQ
jgi:FlaA1/EpsC-like NDP-sugar epimerase